MAVSYYPYAEVNLFGFKIGQVSQVSSGIQSKIHIVEPDKETLKGTVKIGCLIKMFF